MTTNPIHSLLDDATFERLDELGLLHEGALERLVMKRQFHALRKDLGSATDAIRELGRMKHLSFSRVREIVYSRHPFDDLIDEGN